MHFSTIKKKIKRVLIWSQKYTKTDMVYLGKEGFWLFANQITTMLAGFLTALAFANLLSPEVLGTYRYILSFLGVLAIFTLTGMDSSTIRSVSRGFDGTVIKALKEKIKWGLFGTFVALLISIYYYLNNNLTLSLGLALIGVALPFLYSFQIYSSFLQGKKDFKLYAIFSTLNKTVFSLSLITTVLISKNVLVVLSVYLFTYTFLNILFFILTTKKYKTNKQVDKQAVPYGKQLSIMNFFSALASNIDKILLFHFLGAKDVAVYTIAVMPVIHIKDGIRLVGSLALPKLSEKKNNYKFNIKSKLYIMSIFILPIFLFYILVSPYIFKIFFPLYANAIIYTQIFSLMLLATPKLLIDTSLTAFKKVKQLYISRIISPILTIIFMVLLIPNWGIWGAITASLLSQFVNYLILFTVYKQDQ